MEQLSIKSFLRHGHAYHLYLYEKIRNVPEGVIIKDANEILPGSMIFRYQRGPGKGSYAGFSDLFRYKLLLDRGGIWADLDFVCLKPFEFASEYVFMSENRQDGHAAVTSGVIKAPPGSECIEACYDKARKSGPKEIKWGETGPALLASIVEKFRLETFVVPPHFFVPINWWEFKALINPTFQFEISDDTYAVHLWNEMWRRRARRKGIIKRLFQRKKFDKDTLYGAETLYGRLQRMYL